MHGRRSVVVVLTLAVAAAAVARPTDGGAVPTAGAATGDGPCAHLEYGWSAPAGGEGFDAARAIAVDDAGNSYSAGDFTGKVDFDPGPEKQIRKAPHEFGGSFVSSFSPAGVHRWTASAGGGRGYAGAHGVFERDGRVAVMGSFGGKVDFDPTKSRDSRRSATDESDFFLTVFDTDGSYRWTVTAGGSLNEFGTDVVIDPMGDIICVGWFRETVDFDPGRAREKLTSNGATDVFVAKYSSRGDFLWARAWGGAETDVPLCVTANGEGDILVAGRFRRTVDFDPTGKGDVRHSHGESDLFVTTLSADGDYRWTYTAGGLEDLDHAWDVVVGDDDTVYVTGAFVDIVDFDEFGRGDLRRSAGFSDMFLISLAANGTYRWAVTVGGQGIDSGLTIGFDGSLILGGNFQNAVDFDPDDGEDVRASAGGFDAYVARYGLDGRYLDARTWGGELSDHARRLAIDTSKSVLIAGDFLSLNMDFDPSIGVDAGRSNGQHDAYLIKLYCGACEAVQRHDLSVRKGKLRSTVWAMVPQGRVTVRCDGRRDSVRKSATVGDDLFARLNFKALPKGNYECHVAKVEDSNGRRLCSEPSGKRTVFVD